MRAIHREEDGREESPMRRLLTTAFTLAAGIVLATPPATAQQEVMVSGTLVDSSCYMGMQMTANDHGEMKGCGSACLRGGQPAALVTSDGTMYTIVAPSAKLAEHVGQQIRVSGIYQNGAIMAMKAEVQLDGEFTEIDVKGMM